MIAAPLAGVELLASKVTVAPGAAGFGDAESAATGCEPQASGVISRVQAVSVPAAPPPSSVTSSVQSPAIGSPKSCASHSCGANVPAYGGSPTKMLGAASLKLVPVMFAPASELASRTTLPSGARSRSVRSLRFVCDTDRSLIFTERTMPRSVRMMCDTTVAPSTVVLGTSGEGVVMIDVEVRGATAMREAIRLSIGVQLSAAASETDMEPTVDQDGGTGGEAQNRAHDRFASAVLARH